MGLQEWDWDYRNGNGITGMGLRIVGLWDCGIIGLRIMGLGLRIMGLGLRIMGLGF